MKAAWLAVQNLDEAIRYGKRGACCIEGRRLPLGQQLDTIRSERRRKRHVADASSRATPSPSSSTRPCRGRRASKASTPPTTSSPASTRFVQQKRKAPLQVYRVAGRVSRIGESGGGPLRFLGSWLFDLIHLSLPKNFAKFNT